VTSDAIGMEKEPRRWRPVEAELGALDADSAMVINAVGADIESPRSTLQPRWLRFHIDLAGSDVTMELQRLRAGGGRNT
jgi:hypothetical protein